MKQKLDKEQKFHIGTYAAAVVGFNLLAFWVSPHTGDVFWLCWAFTALACLIRLVGLFNWVASSDHEVLKMIRPYFWMQILLGTVLIFWPYTTFEIAMVVQVCLLGVCSLGGFMASPRHVVPDAEHPLDPMDRLEAMADALTVEVANPRLQRSLAELGRAFAQADRHTLVKAEQVDQNLEQGMECLRALCHAGRCEDACAISRDLRLLLARRAELVEEARKKQADRTK